MRLLLLLVFVFPLQALAELPEDESLMRVVVELEELHKVTRDISELGRQDASRPFPYDAFLVEVSKIRSAILRHVQRPSTQLLSNKESVKFPMKVSLNAKEKARLRRVVNQCDSVLSMIPESGKATGKLAFNYPALKADVARLKQYVWEIIVTGNVSPRALVTVLD
ncbi:hypothetical protein [Haliea sp.]|mgnify:CR=1 FL=1|jgi:hypothetical protein|uniref:hypothetical protein n=1 Tax=Haliea sp. TaxID=1932666 RepID=UPI000C3DD7E7|nr:hypothetical protein [Haliea sp.]MAD65692.1 hypothetical protein [Haliea sp.]|tara:strand:+ start:26861 stop:27358 length:498 start_codon:yes stop_codon:yes gene_type:complete